MTITKACALKAIALVAACAGSVSITGCGPRVVGKGESPSDTSPNAYIRAEGPSGVPIHLPCLVDFEGETYMPPSGVCFAALLVEFGRGDSAHGAFRGLSGAPVFRADGTCVGVFSVVLSVRDVGRYCGIVPIAMLNDLWDQVAIRVAPPQRPESGPLCGDIKPGSSIGVAWLWGGKIAGIGGYVCERRGREVVALGHAAIAETGPCSLGLLRAPMIGTSLSDGEWSRVSTWGDLVGSVDYNGEVGVHAILGVVPPHVKLEYVIRDADNQGQPIIVSYYAAKCPSQWGWDEANGRIIRMSAVDAIDRLLSIDDKRSFKVRVSGDKDKWSCSMHVAAHSVEELAGIIVARCFGPDRASVLEADVLQIEVVAAP
jgi:hypothetical protein